MTKSVTKDSFGINLKVLKAFFLYTTEQDTKWHKVRAYVIFFLFMFHVPILGILHFIFDKNIDMKSVSDNGYVLAEMCCYIPKLLPFVIKVEKIKQCIHYFESKSFEKLRENQEKIIETASKICRRNSIIFITCLSGGFVMWATKPFWLTGYKLPIDIWLPFNVTSDLKIYYSVYIWIVLGSGYPAVASSTIEPLIAGLACLAAAHISVLKDNLQHMYEYSNEECKEKIQKNSDIIFRKIQNCIKSHYEILQFVKLYEDCFSQVVFSQFVGSIFVLGFCCFQLIMLEPFSADFLTTLSYLGILLTQIYFYCYYGTSLFEQSDTLTNAVYMGKWYEYDIKSRKALILLSERAKKPIVVTSGKILNLSLETFTTILRRSYSLLAVLNNQK